MAINYPQRYDDDFLNTIKTLIDHVNAHGKTIQDLVADGQLTEEQYARLVNIVNDNAKNADLNELKNMTAASLAILKKRWENEDFAPIITSENLWDIENTTLGTLSETSGNVSDHALNRTLNFTEIVGGEPYFFDAETATKVVFYDEMEQFIEGHGWLSSSEFYVFTAPGNAKYMRATLSVPSTATPENLYFHINIGTEKIEDEEVVYDYGFWDEVPSPPLRDGSVREKHLADDVKALINENAVTHPEQPFPKTLRFEEIGNGWDEVNHLSKDGKVVYFKYGRTVRQSLDDGDTLTTVLALPSEVPSIQAVRDLDDGELLISSTRDEDINLKSKVYKTIGYDRNNPENTEYKEVLEALSSQANIYESWGLEAHDNICLASEYGLRGDNGARHVYLSTDYGETWDMIFDQKTTTTEIEGAPTWTTSAHLHTVHYDRYWERIWLVVGDNPNSATYYSDDMGQTWNYVSGSDQVQYTGIVSFPDGVIFGSDRSPNGIHRWKRTESKDDPVVIEPLELINDENVITHVFQRAFRRYAEKGEPAFFPATRISDFSGTYGSVIMSMTGTQAAYKLYELPANHAALGFYNVVGVTANGNILTSHHNGSGHTILRTKAPLWE